MKTMRKEPKKTLLQVFLEAAPYIASFIEPEEAPRAQEKRDGLAAPVEAERVLVFNAMHAMALLDESNALSTAPTCGSFVMPMAVCQDVFSVSGFRIQMALCASV